uniref:V-type proton ATPase subunit n=1 Tax=Alexandrium catenella TaxID=2925 RepID=A0A7S1WIC5_ALECA
MAQDKKGSATLSDFDPGHTLLRLMEQSRSQGFFAPGLVLGAQVWLAIACVATVVAQAFVKETPKCTKSESRQLSLVIVWVSSICMWLFWSFVYMHQMVPLIYPVHVKGVA